MTLQPNAPEVWEQALFDGRRVHPSDGAAAVAYAKERYDSLGYGFTGEPDPEPEPEAVTEPPPAPAPPEPVVAAEPLSVEAASDGMPAEPAEALPAETETVVVEAAEPAEAVQPMSVTAPARKKRARNEAGGFIADDKSTPDVNEAFVQEP